MENTKSKIPGNCAVTGATGYLGSRICMFFEQNQWKVYQYARQNLATPNWVPFQLSDDLTPESFSSRNIDVLVHCAYDFSVISPEEIQEKNVNASIRLLRTAKAGGVKRIVFISSMSAYDDCVSLFGKAKLAIEKEAHKLNAVVIRPGLIYGDQPGGMVGKMLEKIKSSFFVPVIHHGNSQLYLIHESDLCQLVLDAALGKINSTAPISAAAPMGWTLEKIVRTLGKSLHKPLVFVPIPWQVAWLGLKTFETAGVRLGFRSDSVLALANQSPKPNFENAYKSRFRNFNPEASV